MYNASAGDTDEITYRGTSSSSSSSVIVNDHSESAQNIKVPNVSADVTLTTVTSLGSTVTKSTEYITLPIDRKNIFSSDVPEASAPKLLHRSFCLMKRFVLVVFFISFRLILFDIIEFTTKQLYHTIYLSTKMTAGNNDCHTIFVKHASRKSWEVLFCSEFDKTWGSLFVHSCSFRRYSVILFHFNIERMRILLCNATHNSIKPK